MTGDTAKEGRGVRPGPQYATAQNSSSNATVPLTATW
ncbi:hypothetical protein SAMN05216553_101570 [Lentzea fradiae]|uniref:Uncharacterized protein n=1 Tax=Lentzea fradiae TaxID=200378 RepID=A0A1G7KYQ8_9PSEU|nr:hypothetical protein SAMN05216553_101570 [Lentzea fradiae]